MTAVTPIRPPVENNTNPWLLDGLLPRNEVIFLDGSAGVGKTALLALLSQQITEQNKKRTILYLSSPKQVKTRDTFLHRQRANFGQLHAVDFNLQTKPLQSRHIYADVILCIIAEIREKRPHCLIIDGLDDFFAEAPAADGKISRMFWGHLHDLAAECQCTIIVTRTQGFHEPRAYGHFTRTGSDSCSFALCMHYHPKSSGERVVTIIRHRFGPIGKQFHLKFAGDRAELVEKQASENVRPAKSPAHAIPEKPAKQPKQETAPSQEIPCHPEGEAPADPQTIQDMSTINKNENRAHAVKLLDPVTPVIKTEVPIATSTAA